jgi:hypothetical protein
MAKHSNIGPSGAERWENCPGSVKLSEDCPSRSSSSADEGTLAHAVGEHALLNDVDCATKIGMVSDGHVVDENMARQVQKYVDHVRGLITPGAKLFVEKSVAIKGVHAKCFGTVDAIVAEPFGTLHIVDYKNGVTPVSQVDNKQLALYAIGAYEELEDLDFAEIHLHVCQPNVDGAWPPKPDIWSVERLMEFKKRMRKAALACFKEGAEENLAEGSWCRWCPAQIKCPLKLQKAGDFAAQLFAAEEVPAIQQKIYSVADLPSALSLAFALKPWIAKVIDEGQKALEAGEVVSGYALVSGRNTTEWTKSPDEVAAALVKAGFIKSPVQFYAQPKPLSLSALKKELDKPLKKALDGFVEDNSLTIKVPSSPKIAPIDSAEDFFDICDE